jgi:hypothetical protein
MRLLFWRKNRNETPRSSPPSRQIWDRDPAATRRDPITGLPVDLLTGSTMPDSFEPKLDPDKTRVYDDEIEQD